MNKQILMTIAWLGTVTLAFLIGQGQTEQSPVVEAVKSNSNPSQILEAEEKNTAVYSAKNTETTLVNFRPLTATDAMARTLPLLQERSHFLDFAKMTQVYQSFQNLSEAELQEAFDYADEIHSGQTKATFKAMLYSLWAEKNPMAALEHNQNNSGYSKSWTENTIISVWARKDPVAAYDWYQTVGDDKPLLRSQYTNFLRPIFTQFAKDDFEGALSKLETLSGRDKENSYRGILQGVEDQGTFIALIEQFQESKQSSLVSSTISEWTKDDPLSVIEWSQNLEDKNLAKNYEKQAREAWVKQNPADAADWILSRAEEGKQSQAINEIARSWSWRDSQGLSQWLESQTPEALSDKTYSSVAQRLSRENPYKAAGWATKINDSNEKMKTLRRIYSYASRRDKSAAQEMIQNLPNLNEAEVKQVLN